MTNLINLEHPLVKLAGEISWDKMEIELQNLYTEQGRPSIPIRKIVRLLLLKEMFKESDESVVKRWIENAYWQYFTGEDFFQTKQPFDPNEFVHFRKRLKEVQIDSTVQEKNITFQTDTKLAKKVIDNCAKIAEKEGVVQRQTYKRLSKQHLDMLT
ncbi:transposase [Flavobacterium sp. LB2P84]|uniref:Transposase n=1 Tax=Flavobacterium yafengii TaxID=3041253 RepID=A0AAW6TL87_9FLAO|nr:transposase [Flavobacterium yafengii]MDI5950352.1 transposase [Flavobacterium yafengii]MDI6033741.1 transposase [Flavobacterium yafengii]